MGLLECIDRNPELTVSHARRWTLVKFLWGECRQRQRQSTFCHLLLSMLAVCLPFFSLLLSGFALGASLLQLQHSLDVCLLLPRGSLASPGHTVKTTPQEENRKPVRNFPSRCVWCKAVNGNSSPITEKTQEKSFQMAQYSCVFQTRGSPDWPLSLQAVRSSSLHPKQITLESTKQGSPSLISGHFDSTSVFSLKTPHSKSVVSQNYKSPT